MAPESGTVLHVTDRLRRSLVEANKRVLTALRSPQADTILQAAVQRSDFTELHGHDHCLLVSYKRDGQPVVQPVWPGIDGDRVFVWTESQAYKAKRLQRNPNALLAPCTFRGKPLGAPYAASARILGADHERAHAERVIRSQWGWKRRAFERISRSLTDVVYIELVPVATRTDDESP